MKKIYFVVASAIIPAVAFAALGDVVNSFPAPASYPLALARANNDAYMWVYCNSSPYYIWRIHAETGSIQGSYASPFGSATRGLAYSYGGAPGGSYLWIGNYPTQVVAMCDYNTGSIYASFSLGHSLYGLAPEATDDGGYNPQSLITTYTSPSPGYCWRHHVTSGSLLSSFALTNSCYDVAWDWRNQIIWGGLR